MSPRRFRPPALYTKAPFLKELLDVMPDSVKVIDSQFRVVYANEVSLRGLGLDLNELRGRFCHEAFYGYKEKCFFCPLQKVFEEGRTQVTYSTLAVKGVNRDFEVSTFPMPGQQGKSEYAVEVVRDITPLSKGAQLPRSAGKIASRDRAFGVVFENMAQWAEDDLPVLLQGEKGTGKKSFARALHQRSSRSMGPFRVFHCADNVQGDRCEGLFGEGGAWEKAAGGTLYLDGVCRLGEANQKKLAEMISRPIPGESPRVVAATTEDILSLVHQEKIRVDLYDRFSSRVLRLPALRDRKKDLPVLARHFIETYKVLTGSPAEKLGPDALCQLLTYSWPGNIRELETQIERACLLAKGPEIEKLDIEICPPKAEKLGELLHATEKAYLVNVLSGTKGNLRLAVEKSGLSLKTFRRKMRKYRLALSDFKELS